MTIDEAIAHARLVADENRANAMTIENNYYIPLSIDKDKLVHNCEQCAEEHEQLAEWLELLKWYEQGMEDIPSESGVMPKDIYHTGYDKGRADEREEWKLSVSELLIKYSGDIYEALPDIVKQIRSDAIDEAIKKLSESEDTILSDKQYYTLMELKEKNK